MSFKKSILCLAISTLIATTAMASAEHAIAAAEAAQKSAAAVGHEWRDTGKMIAEAKELAEKGQTDDAIKVAKIAEQQGRDAYAQYTSELKRYSQKQ
ncbi:MAG: hypothetical protein H8E21_00930 [Gammaproteobacteria bacterium]|nr:hypothetical protein [Gammaproteobacteria bacterium]MBL7000371.1 hypothetical protein [Gammaproteobacteria bacterium]